MDILLKLLDQNKKGTVSIKAKIKICYKSIIYQPLINSILPPTERCSQSSIKFPFCLKIKGYKKSYSVKC